MMEKLKHAAAGLLIFFGFACYYVLPDPWATMSLTVGIIAAGVVLFFSEAGHRFINFAKDSIIEVRKVVWPTRKETIQTTAVVFAFVVCMAFFLWIVDKGLGWVLYDVILGWSR